MQSQFVIFPVMSIMCRFLSSITAFPPPSYVNAVA